MVKNLPAMEEDSGNSGFISGSGRSPGGGNGNPFQCFCLENPMDRGAWRATVHRETELDMTEVTEYARMQNTHRFYSSDVLPQW